LLRFVTNLSAKRRQQYATESGGGVLTTPTSQPTILRGLALVDVESSSRATRSPRMKDASFPG